MKEGSAVFCAEAIRRITREEVENVFNARIVLKLKLGPKGIVPTQPHSTDACWDLYATEDIDIGTGKVAEVPTDIYIDIPVGFEGELKTRSSYGKSGIRVHHSVIDAGYKGEISPFVHNSANSCLVIKAGDRIAQFCLRRKVNIGWSIVNDLGASERGTQGHGSSGR